MIKTPPGFKFTATHEWVRTDADGTCLIGITDFAQDALGDIVYVECPAAGRRITQGEAVGVIESVKAAADMYAPVSGEVIAVNEALTDHWERINQDAFGSWLYRLQPTAPGELPQLLDDAAYAAAAEAER